MWKRGTGGFMFWIVLPYPLHIWTCFHLWGDHGPSWITHWNDSDLRSSQEDLSHGWYTLAWRSAHRLTTELARKRNLAMVVLDVKELKEPFTVLRPEEFLENNRFFPAHTFLWVSPSSTCQLTWFRTVPEYIDRSDDVAWMLGCSLILLTIQVCSFF